MKKSNQTVKANLHPRNRNRFDYNFPGLIECCPELASHVSENTYGNLSINYFDPIAVKILNKALLEFHYKIDWDIPNGYLTPPVPGRSDYIHYMADLLRESHHKSTQSIPANIHFLDVGTGANCIYPIIGACEYKWSSVGSEISRDSLKAAQSIINSNKPLLQKIELRLQSSSNHFFKNVIQENEYYDFTMCNPPFFTSKAEALKANSRKQNQLTGRMENSSNFNFGGHAHELWCKGGELAFIKQLIEESFLFKTSCFWFSTLVSKQEHLKNIDKELNKYNPTEIKLIPMSQGQKSSRIIAWTFLSPKQRSIWSETRWVI